MSTQSVNENRTGVEDATLTHPQGQPPTHASSGLAEEITANHTSQKSHLQTNTHELTPSTSRGCIQQQKLTGTH